MRRILSRLPLLVIVVVALVSAGCSDAGELGGPTLGGSLAASVGSFQFTNADLESEIEEWATNPQLVAQAFGVDDVGAPGRRNAQFVASVLSFRIISEQSRQLGAATGFQPDPAQVAEFVSQLRTSFVDPATGESLPVDYSDEFLERLATDVIYRDNLSTIDPATTKIPEVEVNPRYGTFQEQGQGLGIVVPPAGPLPQPFSLGS